MAIFSPADEVASIASGLIDEHHPHLVDVPIVYVFVAPAPRAKGRLILGRARKISGLHAFLLALAAGAPTSASDFFVMEIARDEWDDAEGPQRVALVDHELCHMGIDVDEDDVEKLVIRGHDIEEFNAVVSRHGLWLDDVRAFAAVCASADAA